MNKDRLLLLLSLLSLTFLATTMVLARLFFTGRFAFLFLLWNLFLAWAPLVLALLAFHFHRNYGMVLAFALLWLLFLPNAPYLATDFIHLGRSGGVPPWYDMVMLITFAFTGWLLALSSLRVMQQAIYRLAGSWVSWLFVISSLALSSFGVYLGRYLRWNSWDAFLDPLGVAADVTRMLADPAMHLRIFGSSLLLALATFFIYTTLILLPNVVGQRPLPPGKGPE